MKFLKRLWKYVIGRVDLRENMTPEECQALDDLYADRALMKKALVDVIGAYEAFIKKNKIGLNAKEKGTFSGLRACAVIAGRTLDNLKEKH
jgi:hypothetical protein